MLTLINLAALGMVWLRGKGDDLRELKDEVATISRQVRELRTDLNEQRDQESRKRGLLMEVLFGAQVLRHGGDSVQQQLLFSSLKEELALRSCEEIDDGSFDKNTLTCHPAPRRGGRGNP